MGADVSEENITSIFRVKISRTINQRAVGVSAARGFFPRLILDPENGGKIFLQHVGSHTDHAAVFLRR
jgi:hypothetical protein